MFKKRTYLIALFIFITSCFSDEALEITGAISGSVKESGSGIAIEDANVSLKGGESIQSTLSDSNGNFLFGEITSGMYELTVDKLGFLGELKSVIVNPEKTSSSSFSLQKKIPVAQPNSVELNFNKQEESITLTNKQIDLMSFTTSTSKQWLSVTPNSGSIAPSNTMIIKVIADFTTLSPGTYDETMVINVGGASLSIPIKINYVDPPFIVVTKPKIDDVYTMGDVMPIAWNSNIEGTVKIELLKESSIVLNISTDLLNKNGGAFNWNIPSMESDYYKVLITSKENTDISFTTEPFKIDLGPTKPVVSTATAAAETGINFIKIGGNIESIGVLAKKVNEHGHVYSVTSELPTIADSRTKNGEVTEPKNFISNITELQSAKLYYIRAYATNSLGTSYGDAVSVSTIAGAPLVSTTDPTEITQNSAKSGGVISGDGGSDIIENGLFYDTIEEVSSSSEKIKDSGVKTGAYTVNLSDLNKGTKYYIVAYAQNSGGYGYGEIKSFYTNGDPPTVETSSIDKYSGTKAEVTGKVTSNGGEPLVSYGIAYGKSSSPTIETGKIEVGKEDVESFTAEIADLDISTKYYVRAYATNARGTSYGENKNFTTSNGLPGVTTVSSQGVNGSTATINGKVDDNGGSVTTSYGFAYSETANPTIDGFKLEVGKEFEGSYSGKLTALNSSTKYYVKAYATNANGTSYGEEISFTTTDGMPKVNTVGSRDISGTKATVTGTIVDDGGVNLSSYGFVYSENQNPTIEETKIEVGTTATGGFSGNITGLKSLTKYYFRAYVTNKIGTSYGLELSFTTFDGMPKVTTVEVKDISVTTVNAIGKIDSNGGEDITAYGFVYSKEENPTIEGNKTVVTENTDNVFTGPIGNLTRLTKYYLKAYVTNAAGTAYGKELDFTTIEGPYLTITAPILNQKLTIGKAFNITWDTNKTEGNVTIEHWKGSVKTELSNETAITAKTYTWSISSSATEGDDNSIKITENNDTSKTYESPKFSLSNTTYIPDDEFEKKLIAAGWDDVLDDYVVTANISGLTTLGTALAGGGAIKDLTGIEAFVALENLDVGQNELTTVDLSKNTALKILDVGDNKLTEIDLTKLVSLTNLIIESNALTALDISKNIDLEELQASFIKFSSIDVSNNTKLKKLIINGTDGDASSLSTIDLSKNLELTNLGLKSNSLTGLDLTNQSKDKLTALDVSLNPFNCILVTQAQLDAYKAGNLSGWIKGSSQVFSTDCTRTYVPDDYFENELIKLGYDDVIDDYVTTENIIGVKTLDLDNAYITDITGLSSFSSLESLKLKNLRLGEVLLDLSSNSKLKLVELNKIEINAITISDLSDLETFKVYDNKITSLDISSNKNLKILSLRGTNIFKLDLSQNINLIELYTGSWKDDLLSVINYKNKDPYAKLDFTNLDKLEIWENYSNLSLCIKVTQNQFDNIPSGWKKNYRNPTANPGRYSTYCMEVVAGYDRERDGLNTSELPLSRKLGIVSKFVVDKNDDIIFASDNYHTIEKWSKGSDASEVIVGTKGPSYDSDRLETRTLKRPTDFVYDSNNNLYVSDHHNRILKFKPGETKGTIVAGLKTPSFNEYYNLDTGFNLISSLAIDSNDNLYIADSGNYRILKWNYLATSPTWVYPQSGEMIDNSYSHFSINKNPKNLYIDDDNGILWWTKDTSNNNFYPNEIVKYDLNTKKRTGFATDIQNLNTIAITSKIFYYNGYMYFEAYGQSYGYLINHGLYKLKMGDSYDKKEIIFSNIDQDNGYSDSYGVNIKGDLIFSQRYDSFYIKDGYIYLYSYYTYSTSGAGSIFKTKLP